MAARRKSTNETPHRRSWFKWGLLLVVVGLIGGVAAAPTLLSHSALRDTLLNSQMPPGGWRVESSAGSLSWTGGQSLTNVALIAPDGNPLLTVESIQLERTLAGLAMSRESLGRLRLIRPVGYVTTRAEGSNIEDFLAAFAQRPVAVPGADAAARQARAVVPIDLAIEEGSVFGYDFPTGAKWQVEHANLNLAMAGVQHITAADGLAIVRYAPEQTGRVTFRVQAAEDNAQQLDLLAEGLELEPLQPWVTRFVGACELAGSTAVEAHVLWNPQAPGPLAFSTWGRATAEQFRGALPQFPGDRLECAQLEVPWNVRVQGEELAVSELQFKCEWAQLAAQGAASLTELRQLNLKNLPQRECLLSGKVSLARLAQMLPGLLQIREGVRIDTGDIEWTAQSGLQDGVFSWSAEASLTDLAGQEGTRAIRWAEPVKISALWKNSAVGPRLDRFALVAPSAEANVVTTDNRMHGDFQVDLRQLADQVGQFVDLQQIECRGYGRGNFLYTTSDSAGFEAQADVKLSELVVLQGERLLWEEPQLAVDLQASGLAENFFPKLITAGSLELRGDRDEVRLTLLDAVDVASRVWHLKLEGQGPVDSWAGRLRPWMRTIPDQVAGQAKIEARLAIAGEELAVSDLVGSVDNLRIQGSPMVVDEPHVEFAGDCQWNLNARRLISQQFQLAGSIVAFRSRDLRIDLAPATAAALPVMTGEIAYRADLERLAAALGMVGGREAIWPRGSAAGVLRLATTAEQIQGDFSAEAESVQLVRTTETNPAVLWAEPKLRASGKAVYDLARKQLSLEPFNVAGQTGQLVGTATWDDPQGGGPIGIGGRLEYDPATVDRLLASTVGPSVRVQGDRVVQFEAQGTFAPGSGTHWSRVWRANAEAGWSAASVFGLPITPGKLQGTLAEGQVTMLPLDVAIGGGRFAASPRMVLDPPPRQVLLPAGRILSDVQISPAVSEQMLKYVAPILAGATRVEGEFSVDLADTRISLDDPRLTQTAGNLSVDQLTVLPGPMIADLASAVQKLQALEKGADFLQTGGQQRPPRLLVMRNQQVEFQVRDQRVHHRNLEFTIDDVPVRSQGSVGFDQSLALMIEVPIQDRWLKNEQALAGLSGKSLQIPIYGTFDKPRVDQQAVANLTRDLLRDTARQAIGGEINRQLEKLFKQR